MIYCFIKTSITYDDLEKVILTKEESELKAFSLPLDQFTDELTGWTSKTFNGIIVSKALDVFCVRLNEETKLVELKQFLKKWLALDQFSVYCGISNTIDEAYKAMVFAQANKLKTIMMYSEEVEDFLDKELEKMEPEIERLVKMALKDISVPEPSTFRGTPNRYDYTSLLPQEFQSNHKITLDHTPYPNRYGEEPINVTLHRLNEDGHWETFGKLDGLHFPNDKEVHIQYARLGDRPEDRAPYRGKHVGRAMYEAFMAHGANKLNATHLSGSEHSTAAGKVHAALSKKHNLGYRPRPSGMFDPNREEPGANDYKNAGYRYRIKNPGE